MGLPASQRRILEKIENAMRGTDPRLTSLFAIFSRLNRDEEMPRIEELRARAWLLRRRAAFFLPLALVVVTSTFVVAAALPGPSRCAAAAAAVGTARHSAKVRNCKGAVMNPVLLGK
jgi:Protein of unknown function (DUF3040)